MAISKGFRYKDKEGKVTDYEYGVNGSNVTQDSEHRLVTDEEKQTWNDKADLEDIPSGSAASHAVANNCTTTAAGSVLDARQGKVLMDKANQLSSDLKFPDGTGFYPDVQNGQRGYNTDPARGADTFSPFNSIIYVGTGTSSITVPQGKVPDDAVASDFFLVSEYGSASMSRGETNQRPQGSLSAAASLSVASYSNGVLKINNSVSAYCGMTVSPYSAGGNFSSVRAYYIKGGLPTV